MSQISKELQYIEDYIDALLIDPALQNCTPNEALRDVREEIQNKKKQAAPKLVQETKGAKIYVCPACAQDFKIYRTYFTNLQVQLLYKIFKYCIDKKTNVIQKKDLPNLSRTEYWNFYTLQRFGMLYYLKDENGHQQKGGEWGVPLKRVSAFLKGKHKVAKYYIRNTATKQNTPAEEKITINEVKKIEKIIDEVTNVPTFVEYEEWQNNLDFKG